MSRNFARVWLAVLTLLVSCRTLAGEPDLRSGDLVFQTSRSAQSRAIQLATGSPWSHVGIVERGRDGTWVVEAIGRVSRTPWRAWRARGASRRVLVARPLGVSAEALDRAVAEAKKLLGRRYDARFGWGDDRIYCSELVAKAFARGAGLTLGRMERLSDLRIAGLERVIEKRWGGPVPSDLLLVTPASIAADAKLARVYER